MSVKTVTLSEDAYRALSSRKKEGESFSDVVRRLSQSDRSLAEFAGAWKDAPPERMKEFERWLETSDRASRTEMADLAPRRAK